MLNHIERTPGLPEEYSGLARLPVEPYVSPAYFDAVRERIFERSWLGVALTREIPEGTEGVVKHVPTLGKCIAITRSGKDEVRGFQFDPLEPHAPFTEVALRTWRGFVFANFAKRPKESLESALGEFGERYKSFPFERFTHKSRFTVILRCNWMTAVDAFQEAYHAAYLHGAWSNGNPKSRNLECVISERNRSTVFSSPGRNPPPPIQAAAQRHGRSGLYASSDQASSPIPAVNINSHADYLADINAIFPNMFINMTSRNFWTHRFWPLSHNHTFYETAYYDSPPQNYAEDVALSYNRSRILTMLLEDFEMLTRTQRGLESGAIKEVIVGDQEALLRHFSSVVAREIGASGKA